MGRQDGILKLRGQLGGISFYKSKGDGYLARQKGSVDGERLRTDPAFQRTRENGQEFARAGRAGKLIRQSLSKLLVNLKDGRMTSRLTREIMRVIQADVTNPRGQRNVVDGEPELLVGFEFNGHVRLGTLIAAPFTPAIDRATGQLTITLPPFVPALSVSSPPGATHFKLLSAGVAIDFEEADYEVNEQVSEAVILDMQEKVLAPVVNQLTAGTTRSLFLAFGIAFYQAVNGVQYPLLSGDHNALALVAVDGGAKPV